MPITEIILLHPPNPGIHYGWKLAVHREMESRIKEKFIFHFFHDTKLNLRIFFSRTEIFTHFVNILLHYNFTSEFLDISIVATLCPAAISWSGTSCLTLRAHFHPQSVNTNYYYFFIRVLKILFSQGCIPACGEHAAIRALLKKRDNPGVNCTEPLCALRGAAGWHTDFYHWVDVFVKW